MIKIFKGNEINKGSVLNREVVSFIEQEGTVKEIIREVRTRKDAALFDYCEMLDKVKLDNLVVSEDEIKEAYKRVSKEFIDVVTEAKRNIEAFHKMQIKSNFEMKVSKGIVLGQKYTPIEKVGIYVPGGTASYPSTVLMNAIPAKIAGVSKIVMTTPPQRNGKIKDEILAAAKIAGVDVIIKCGGAQAIAALAYGTESVPKVDKIVGPGNIFVAIAKRLVFGIVGIDMIAGPSEILIIADKSANSKFVAADLLSQAEHDKLATAVLVTDSDTLAMAVSSELERQLPELSRYVIARESIDTNGKIIIVKSVEEAIEMSNLIAPEHLEICTVNPYEKLPLIKNAGSIFLGNYSPEPLGDYYAGPNHTLPTGGSARFSSPLSVDDFIKKSSYQCYSKEELALVAEKVAYFADSEGLTAHAKALRIRGEEKK